MERKRCHYEVLGVERAATVEEIRSAYRREALRWHPDKIQLTGVSADEAKERFQEISSAYEVLGDPLERKWYDSHRSEILSSQDELTEFEINLWGYFSPSAYSGYGDSRKSFYGVYSEVFGNLFTQEQMFARKFGTGSDSVKAAPPFGDSSTEHSQVSAFYDYWLGFKTVKDYSWCDEYDLSEAPNRKVRRIMEEENKKCRKKAQREFNETVRQLAAFVKKRDKREMERQMEMQRLMKQREQEQKKKREQAEKDKRERLKVYKEQEWAKVQEEDNEWEDASEEEDKEECYCIICEKRFRSQKQWQNHEKSKKHVERVAELREAFLEEDEELARKLGHELASASQQTEEQSEEQPVVHIAEQNHEPEEVEPHSRVFETDVTSDAESEAEDDESRMLSAMLNSHRNRVPVVVDAADSSEAELLSEEEEPVEKPSRSRTKSEKQTEAAANRHAAVEAEVSNLGRSVGEVKLDGPDDQQNEKQEAEKPGTQNKRKNRKKAKKSEIKVNGPVKNVSKSSSSRAPPSSTCEVCGTNFDSRNLLFKHLESTKHTTSKTMK